MGYRRAATVLQKALGSHSILPHMITFGTKPHSPCIAALARSTAKRAFVFPPPLGLVASRHNVQVCGLSTWPGERWVDIGH